MAKIELKTGDFDENKNTEIHLRTIKQIFKTVQPDQVNEFIADLHKILSEFTKAKAKHPSLKFKGFKWKPNNNNNA